MTNQDKKAYLRQYSAADGEINDLLRRKDETMARLTRVTPTYSGMPGGGGDGDKYTNGVAKIIELEEEIDRRTDALVDKRREIERCIDATPDAAERRLLKLRYIDGMKWERIALEMSYTQRQVLRIHGNALENLHIVQDVIECH